ARIKLSTKTFQQKQAVKSPIPNQKQTNQHNTPKTHASCQPGLQNKILELLSVSWPSDEEKHQETTFSAKHHHVTHRNRQCHHPRFMTPPTGTHHNTWHTQQHSTNKMHWHTIEFSNNTRTPINPPQQ
ncbi:hypothetical protein, partial [Corynebacterium riegelii]|uniref:hypothetical protein n=1 Tax=Corynebacterium riegelii TaxID=156976 RepID=UPI001C60D5EB